MKLLRCRRVVFFSPGDEASFFAFASGIKAVKRISGEAMRSSCTLRTGRHGPPSTSSKDCSADIGSIVVSLPSSDHPS
jgi:hypothetical protein